MNEATEFVNNGVDLLTPFFKLLEVIKSYTGPVGTLISIVSYLIGKTDELQLQISKLETSISITNVKGSLRVLESSLNNIQDTKTTPAQVLAEISNAINEFHRLLPKFTSGSVLYTKYYLGAPLFVQICALFKVLILFARNTREPHKYNNPGLENLVREYQQALDSFRIRCIRERCLSIYMYDKMVEAMGAEGGGCDPKSYYVNTLTQFPNYFAET